MTNGFKNAMCHLALLRDGSVWREGRSKPLTSTNARWAPSGSNRRLTD